MDEAEEPSAVRQHVGLLIRLFRQRAGLTQQQLAKQVHVSESLEGAYERAERIPSAGFLIDADQLTDAEGALASCVDLMEAEPSRAHFLEWRRLEAEALSLGGYVGDVFPGLLQSADYMRELFRSAVPAYSEDEVERLLKMRLERHPVLSRTPAPTVSFVMEEATLRRPLGGEAVLKGALLHVLECVRGFNNVTLQVMPTYVKSHAGVGGSLHLLFSPDGRTSVYLDTQGRGKLLTRPDEANQYVQRYGAIRAQALSPYESVELIERLAGEL